MLPHLVHCIDSEDLSFHYIIHHIFTFVEVEQSARQMEGKVAEQWTHQVEGRVAEQKAQGRVAQAVYQVEEIVADDGVWE